jgi:Protein of unknown function (DUF2591)
MTLEYTNCNTREQIISVTSYAYLPSMPDTVERAFARDCSKVDKSTVYVFVYEDGAWSKDSYPLCDQALGILPSGNVDVSTLIGVELDCRVAEAKGLDYELFNTQGDEYVCLVEDQIFYSPSTDVAQAYEIICSEGITTTPHLNRDGTIESWRAYKTRPMASADDDFGGASGPTMLIAAMRQYVVTRECSRQALE